SQNRVTPQHQVVQKTGQCWLARTNKNEQQWPDNVEQILLPVHGNGVDLVLLMMQLGKRQINSVWAECGPALAGALLSLGLVDELILYIAPKVLGNSARGLFDI
ncbi:dihydrofolate reductase family protein, partial [Xenorhabdus bovienii]|uniref:dihydrofolate reductase family protein n=2 Tax=Xenorhabdus bovienii TaxID=40576 RepID=UPI0023B27D91